MFLYKPKNLLKSIFMISLYFNCKINPFALLIKKHSVCLQCETTSGLDLADRVSVRGSDIRWAFFMPFLLLTIIS